MLDKDTLKELKKIIFSYFDPKKDKVFIFGSRAVGKYRKFSDIDIGIESKKKIEGGLIEEVKGKFEESDIPYTVDVVNFSNVSGRFKKLAKEKIIPLN